MQCQALENGNQGILGECISGLLLVIEEEDECGC